MNGELYAYDYQEGLVQVKGNGILHFLPEPFILPEGDPVTGIISLSNNTKIITALKSGLYILDDNRISVFKNTLTNKRFSDARIYSACRLSDNRIVLATSKNGAIVIDDSGNIIQKFSKEEGLQNKNVLSVFADKNTNIWLGLDNGIDLIHYNSALKKIEPLRQDGSGYAAFVYHQQLYMGTSGGLFSFSIANREEDLSFSIGEFSKVESIDGQIWNLNQYNDQLLVGCHEGAYSFDGKSINRISEEQGYWNFLSLTDGNLSQIMVAGNYKGLTFFQWNGTVFVPQNVQLDFNESSRFLVKDLEGNIWVSHPYHGIYRISSVNTTHYQYKLYNEKNGLPSALNNYVYFIQNKLLIATEQGIYEYDKHNDRFIPSNYFQKVLGKIAVRYLKEDYRGNIWYVYGKALGVIDKSHGVGQPIEISELKNKLLSGFEFVYPVDSGNIIVGGERGFFHINYEKYKRNEPSPTVQIDGVLIQNKIDSLLFGGQYGQKTGQPQIQYGWNSLYFDFGSTDFGNEDNLSYSFRLKGFDDNWSEYGKAQRKAYTSLSPGNYTFEVKSRNNFGKESTISAFSFQILPPWHRTWWAYCFYALFFLSGNYVFYIWLKRKFKNQRIRYEEEQKKLVYIHELEKNNAEKELVDLKNEKLEAEINFKNSELASSALHLVQKGELLGMIQEKLGHVLNTSKDIQSAQEIKRLLRSLNGDEKMEEEWDKFAKHFDQVHHQFTARLKEKHPSITGNDIKLCSYLRMNLSTKEMAQLMNISVRGVEVSRYRLRKKLQLPTETSLFDYLITISDDHP